MTLVFLATSMCNWNFLGEGSEHGPATLLFNWLSEQGRILCAGESFDVRKHGLLAGRWTVERRGEVFAEAHKPSVLLRTFDLRASGVDLTLRARGVFSRAFE